MQEYADTFRLCVVPHVLEPKPTVLIGRYDPEEELVISDDDTPWSVMPRIAARITLI